MDIDQLRTVAASFREQADDSAEAEEALVAAMESGSLNENVGDSQRFDLWQADAERFHSLLARVEEFLNGQ